MATFKDSQCREWQLSIDVLQLKRVRERTRFELGKLLANEMSGLKQLANDPELLVDVLFVLVEDQAKGRKIEPEEFGRSMVGDALESGFDTLLSAFADFCPSRQAKPLRALLAKSQELNEAATERALEAIGKLTPTTILNGSPGSVAASSESIPAPTG